MELSFTKMQGCGNDYIYINGFDYDIKDPNKLAVILSDRHFGIGGDGIIIAAPSDIADAKMKMYNADGSEGKMCGNGIRCMSKFIYDNKLTDKSVLKIETLSGIKTVSLIFENEVPTGAKVDMGEPVFAPSLIPVLSDEKEIVDKCVSVGGRIRKITCVSMGNPHCVIFVPEDFDLDNFDIEEAGIPIENDPIFPEKTNVEFIKFIDESNLKMRVWERGSGETFACGTGACASAAAACRAGLCNMDSDITVHLRGGDLKIRYSKSGIEMTGAAANVFKGTIEI